MKVLVFCEQRNNVLKKSAFEALSAAYELSKESSDVEVSAVLLGSSQAELIEQLEEFGAKKVFHCSHDSLTNYNPISYTDAFYHSIKQFSPDYILGVASPMGRDLFARTSARLDTGLLTDIIEFKFNESSCIGGIKPMYAGKVLAQINFNENCSTKMLTIRPNIFASKLRKNKAQLEAISFNEAPLLAKQCKTIEITKGKQNKADLTEAQRIISGGRAMENADNFKILHDCAETLKATVGASRAAVDSGYAPHSMQVGQTGKTVNPSLYIACGISGSIQHMAGMKTSKTIIAINTDPNAPIFSIADYAIVADLFEDIPLFTESFKSLLEE